MVPKALRRLYIARDNDPAGRRAAETLAQRTQGNGIDAMVLTPTMGDFNDDLRQLGAEALINAIRVQLAPEDVARFWMSPDQHRQERLSVATCIVCRDVTVPRQPG